MTTTADAETVLDRDACRGCGREIVQVDLYGHPFFTHMPRRDCLTWWHVDPNRTSHQAVPIHTVRDRARADRLGGGEG